MPDTLDAVTVQPLTPDDLAAVVAIDRAGSGVSRQGYFEKRLQAALDQPRDYVFVGVFDRGALAGFAFAKLVSGDFGKTGASAALDAIGVDPGHGLQGLGSKLLAEVEAVLRHKGVSILTSQVDWNQGPMLTFLAHSGFMLAPAIILTRSTRAMAQELEDDPADEALERDYSSPEGDAGNALSRDRIPVRSMTEADLARIVSIDAEGSGQERGEYFARMQNENLNQSGVRVSLVAELDGIPAGFIMARVDFGEFGRAGSEAVMDAIGVDPGFRNQGVGHALMAKLLVNLNVLQVESVRTEVGWNDTALIDYFGAVGFEPAQRLKLCKPL